MKIAISILTFLFAVLHADMVPASPKGIATWYEHPYLGQPLFCDRGQGLIYSEMTTPWVAVDISEYLLGRIQCGDKMWVIFEDGKILRARALDAGYLYRYRIADYPDLPIIVDIPRHLVTFPGLSARCRTVNHSAGFRRGVRRLGLRARTQRNARLLEEIVGQ